MNPIDSFLVLIWLVLMVIIGNLWGWNQFIGDLVHRARGVPRYNPTGTVTTWHAPKPPSTFKAYEGDYWYDTRFSRYYRLQSYKWKYLPMKTVTSIRLASLSMTLQPQIAQMNKALTKAAVSMQQMAKNVDQFNQAWKKKP